MQNSHVILIIVMVTHCLVRGSRMQQHCGLICAAGALSHKKAHAVNLIGAPEIRTARHQAQEIARSTPDPLPRVGVGSGTETIEVHQTLFPAWGLGLGTRLTACACYTRRRGQKQEGMAYLAGNNSKWCR